jgi:small subunit ribosomal protein S16
MYKNHLQGGVAKGALTQEQADAKLAKWISEKETKINAKVSKLATGEQDSYKKRLAAEVAAKEAKAAKIIAKNTPPAPVVEAEAAAPAPDAETPQAEA